jgi:hypothetical protein
MKSQEILTEKLQSTILENESDAHCNGTTQCDER